MAPMYKFVIQVILNITVFVLYMTVFFLNMTGLVLNMTEIVPTMTGFNFSFNHMGLAQPGLLVHFLD